MKQPVQVWRVMAIRALATLALALPAGCGSQGADPATAARDAQAALAHNDWHQADTLLKAATRDGHGDPGLQLLAARVALEQGDAGRAALLLEAVTRAAPDALPADEAAQVRPLLAKAQLAQGNAAAALQVIGPDEPADPVSAAVKVRALVRADNTQPGMALLDRALAGWPASPDLKVLDGVRAMARGDRTRADAIATDLLAHAPEDFEAVVFAGQVALGEGRARDAQDIFTRANHLRPDHQVPMLALAGLARSASNHAEEMTWLDRARKAAPGDVWIALYGAQIAFDSGHADEAARLLTPFADKPNANNALRLLAGLAFAQVGRKEDAINQLNAYVLHGGDDGRARFALAVMLTQKGDPGAAWRALKPLAMTANAGAAPLQLAARLAAANHDPAAADLAARAAATPAVDPDAAAMTEAQTAIRAHDWAHADAVYAQMLATAHAHSAIAYNNAAYVRIELGRAGDAVPLARKALALAPDDPVTIDTLGLALLRSGTGKGEATTLLQRAAQLRPGDADIRAHLAEATGAKP